MRSKTSELELRNWCTCLRYFDHLRELGFTLLQLQPVGVLADPEHRWGLAPFHYTQDLYEEIVTRVLALRENSVR